MDAVNGLETFQWRLLVLVVQYALVAVQYAYALANQFVCMYATNWQFFVGIMVLVIQFVCMCVERKNMFWWTLVRAMSLWAHVLSGVWSVAIFVVTGPFVVRYIPLDIAIATFF